MISTSSSIDKANIAKLKVFEESIANDLAVNMVSGWKLDGNASDAWGGNDGAWNGVAAGDNRSANYRPGSECVSGQCLDFDGTDDYIDLSNHVSSLKLNTGTLTVWFKTNSTGTHSIFAAGDLLTDFLGLGIGSAAGAYNNESLHFGIISDNVWRFIGYVRHGEQYYADNKWHHVVVAVGSSFNKIYIDGVNENMTYEYGSASIGNYFLNPSNLDTMAIGRRFYPNSPLYFNGLIDNVRIYNAALSSSQIKQNYIAGLDSLLSKGNISKEDYNQRINALAYNEYE